MADAVKPGNSVMQCVNLRPSADSDGDTVLTPVGLPPKIAENAGCPLLEYVHDDGSVSLFTASGSRLMCVRDGAVTTVCTLGGPITCGAPVPAGCVTVMAEGCAPAVIRHDRSSGRWTADTPVEFVDPVITAETVAVISEAPAVAELKSPAYGAAASVTVAPAHRTLLSRAMSDAYTRLHARAAAAGAWLQPVLVRVRYLDSDGHTLCLTPPRLVGLPAAPVAEGTLESDTRASALSGMAFAMRAYRLRVRWPEEAVAMAPQVAAVAVEVTPQIHPVDPAGVSECRATRLTADSMRLQVSLPGMRLDGDVPEAVARMVPQALCRFDALARVAAVIRFRQGEAAAATLLRRPAGDSVVAEIRSLARVIPAASGFTLRDAVVPPHAFTARTVAVNGNSVAWGGITPLPRVAPSVMGLAADTGEPSVWSGSVQVTFDSVDDAGVPHSAVRTFRHNDLSVTALSPLVVCPDPRAVSVRIAVGLRSVTLPLSPTPDGRMAYYLSPGLTNITLDTQLTSQVVPAENPRPLGSPGGVVVAAADAPWLPLAAMELSGGRVSAITPSARSRSSWDFGRHHFYILGDAGIHALSVGARGDTLAAACVCPLDASEGAVALTPDGVMAVAAGRLMKITGSMVDMLEPVGHVTSMAFDVSRGELWMRRSDSTVAVRVVRSGATFVRSMAVSGLLGASGRVYVGCADGTLRVAEGDDSEVMPPGGIQVRWVAGDTAPRGARAAAVRWHITAASAILSLDVCGDGGTGIAQSDTLLSLRVNGRLVSPLPSRMVAPPRRHLSVALNGLMSAGAVIRAAEIMLS